MLEYFLPEAMNLVTETEDMTADQKEALAKEKLAAAYDPANIYITDSYIAFVSNKAKFADGAGAGAGIYEFIIDWNTAHAIGAISNPEEIFAE